MKQTHLTRVEIRGGGSVARVIGLSLATLVLALPACRSPLDTPAGGYGDWIDHDPAAWQLDERAATHRDDTLRTELDADRDEVGSLPPDAETWVAAALRRHPGLRAAEQRVIRLRERGPQVSSLDDPTLRVVPIGEQSETAAGRVRVQAGVSQTFPFPGKLDAKAAMADRDAATAEMRLAEMRLEVANSVRRAFWGWRYANRAVAVVRRDEELLGQFLEVAQAKYRAGTTEQQDVLRARVELASVEKQLLELQQQRVSSSAMLNRLVDRPAAAPLPAFAAGEDLTEIPAIDADLDRLLAAAARHPKLAGLREQAARYREERRLANLNRYPDLTVSVNYAAVDDDGVAPSANGDDQWSVGFGVNLPLWQGRRDAAERAALAGLYETAAMLADEQNQLAFRVQDALARVRAERQTLLLFRDRMLPDAEQAVSAAGSSYRAGNTDFLTLIDNWRRLTGLRLTYEQVMTRLQQDLADLRLATAGLAMESVPKVPQCTRGRA